MKILFLGLGSIGKKHAKLILEKYNFELYAYRTKLGQEPVDIEIKEMYDLEKALDLGPDLVFITNPTYLHIETAIKCAERGIDLFIEKPLSHDLNGISILKKIVKQKKIFTYVGLCMRFHPIIEEIKKRIRKKKVIYTKTNVTSYLPNWRPNQDYRKSFSAYSEKGGGILLELIHDLDYNYWLFGDIKELNGRYGKISKLEINSEDFGDMMINFENGILGNIHFNWFSFNNERKIKIYCTDMYIEGDLIKNFIIVKDRSGNVEKKEFEIERNEIYKKQLEYFFKCYKKKKKPMNDINEATKVLKYLLDFKEANQLI